MPISYLHLRFGKKVESRMNQLGLSVTKLAKNVGVTRGYIAFIIKGDRSPTLSVIIKIAQALQCRVIDLFK